MEKEPRYGYLNEFNLNLLLQRYPQNIITNLPNYFNPQNIQKINFYFHKYETKTRFSSYPNFTIALSNIFIY